jgi:hypothetical protein
MKVAKITEEYFDEVKRSIRWTTSNRAARKHGISLKTVLQIRNSKNYQEYREQVKAQHPYPQFSLAEEVLTLHKLVFDKGEEYHKPMSAKTAIGQLQYKLGKTS